MGLSAEVSFVLYCSRLWLCNVTVPRWAMTHLSPCTLTIIPATCYAMSSTEKGPATPIVLGTYYPLPGTDVGYALGTCDAELGQY